MGSDPRNSPLTTQYYRKCVYAISFASIYRDSSLNGNHSMGSKILQSLWSKSIFALFVYSLVAREGWRMSYALSMLFVTFAVFYDNSEPATTQRK